MKRTLLFTLLAGISLFACAQSLPHLTTKDGRTQLIVNQQPYYALAGELHNSSTGSAEYGTQTHLWEKMASMHLNTVIAAVSWELLEPQEGDFHYEIVDDMISQAQKNHLKLVLLWFGSWKNGTSLYAPEWVKKDTKRFPLAVSKNGKKSNTLSTLSENTRNADANAFVHLMQHLKETDKNQTVLMVQVENEVGTLDMLATYMHTPNGSMRDYNEAANKAFQGQVPSALISYLKKNKKTLNPVIDKAWATSNYKEKGTWEEVFGKSPENGSTDFKNQFSYLTEEIFNAWNYANYIGYITEQGKKAYNLPMYVNAWMRQPSQPDPGLYPSGGPQAHLLDIWRAGAPAIDFLAPDIYVVNIFDDICSDYLKGGNPLFIPETKCDASGAARALYAFGKYGALCYSPFGIDGGGLTNSATPEYQENYRKVYGCLQHLMPEMQTYAGTSKAAGLYMENGKPSQSVKMGNYTIQLRPFSLGNTMALFGTAGEEKKQEIRPAGAIIFQTGEDEFLVAMGIGDATLSISGNPDKSQANVGYASIDEMLENAQGELVPHRLNGDETAFGGPTAVNGAVKIFRIRMYTY